MTNALLTTLKGDCRETLKTFPDASVQCCVTSPPYWGLRSYLPEGHELKPLELGQERTPEEYVANMVQVFAEAYRVLKPDGTCWLNLGDCYSGGGKGGNPGHSPHIKQRTNTGSLSVRGVKRNGRKPKDLVGIPWLVAFALQSSGWYLRCDIIWHKPNPMPESVTDRPTKAHEYLFLLSKSERYFYDADSISEFQTSGGNGGFSNKSTLKSVRLDASHKPSMVNAENDGKRNKRSVWTIPTAPYAGAHFAAFPPALVRPCVLAGSRPGDVVLDPFGGSGTVGQVAIELGRKAILCELNPDYHSLIEDRCRTTPGLILK